MQTGAQDHTQVSFIGWRSMKIISYLFAAMFLGLFGCMLLGLGYVVSTGIFFLIRLFKPRFGTLALPPLKKNEQDNKEVKRIGIDFIVAERLRRQRALKLRMEELLNTHAEKSTESDSGNEWDLISLKKQVLQLVGRPRGNPAEPEDLWSICIMKRDHPQYLCTPVMPTKEGLRTAWAPLPDRALKTSAEAAFRWLSVLPGASVIPANAAARQKIRNEALKIRSEALKSEVTNGQKA